MRGYLPCSARAIASALISSRVRSGRCWSDAQTCIRCKATTAKKDSEIARLLLLNQFMNDRLPRKNWSSSYTAGWYIGQGRMSDVIGLRYGGQTKGLPRASSALDLNAQGSATSK